MLRIDFLEAPRTAGSPAKSCPARPAANAAVRPHPAKPVILRALGLVGEHVVSFLDLLELGFGLLIAGVAIGVMLPRQLPVRLFDFVFGGVSLDPKNFVVIAGHSLNGASPTNCYGCDSGFIVALSRRESKIALLRLNLRRGANPECPPRRRLCAARSRERIGFERARMVHLRLAGAKFQG